MGRSSSHFMVRVADIPGTAGTYVSAAAVAAHSGTRHWPSPVGSPPLNQAHVIATIHGQMEARALRAARAARERWAVPAQDMTLAQVR